MEEQLPHNIHKSKARFDFSEWSLAFLFTCYGLLLLSLPLIHIVTIN